MNTQQSPHCVGFIMDGNRRYAKEHDRPTLEGHQAGERTFKDSIAWIKELNIPHAVYYAFSTENWKRTEEEVTHLMDLFEHFLRHMLLEISSANVQVKIIGRRSDFSPQLQALMKEVEESSRAYSATTIWIALSYGGRAEILAAANTLIEKGEVATEESFANALWTAGMPDPDLIIRTGGDMRLSNFLPWQAVYSELFFTPTYWPAFTKEEFTRILAQYADRQRRHGA